MAQWKVFKDRIELYPHPNADRLMLGKVGPYQVVVQKGIYQGGEDVIFIPEKSVLPEDLQAPWKELLGGPDKDRVRSVRLRGELSMGVVSNADEFFPQLKDIPYGEDVSERLGIHKYEPPIPQSLSGDVERLPDGMFSEHDVEQFGIYSAEFGEEEEIVVTEKIHGSQVVFGRSAAGEIFVASKGLMSRGLALKESDRITYWRAGRAVKVFNALRMFEPNADVQFIGEVVPVQKGFDYGFDPQAPSVLFFDVRVNGSSIPFRSVPQEIRAHWVPILYRGRFSKADFKQLSSGVESVSGKGKHIKEGIVVRPYPDRLAADGTRLMVKVLNKKYLKQETGDEIN